MGVCMDSRGRKMTFFLLCMILHAVAADPSITCFQDSQKCEVSSDNLIEVFVETTWEECSLLCQDNLSCLAFNFFGSSSGDGGEDGGDADDSGSYKGGHGSGLDIGSVNMTKFTLSPGKAGTHDGNDYGGGGGGVIVNGEKPESRTEHQGEGFG